MNAECEYRVKSRNGYETAWQTSCGREVVCQAPMEVGFAPAPLPNSDGKFCHYCGKTICVKE